MKHIHIGAAGFFIIGLAMIIWLTIFRLYEHSFPQNASAQGLAWIA